MMTLSVGSEAALFELCQRPDSDYAAAPLRHRDAGAQKLLLIWTVLVEPPMAQITKSFFASFCSQKEVLSSCLT
jgi:hypothetical protein